MQPSSPLDLIPLSLVFVGTYVSILLIIEFGYRLGQWRRARTDLEKEAPVGGMVTAGLGLLALLLAFAFGVVASRHDLRRDVLLAEVNATGTAHLRCEMLPEPHASTARALLRDYVDMRLEAVHTGQLRPAVDRSEEIHARLWTEATAVARADARSVPAGLFVEALNTMIDLHTTRVQVAVRYRLPLVAWATLAVVAVASFLVLGYHGGLSGTARSPAVVVLSLAFSAVISLVADLERPHAGMVRVSQQPMTDLRNSMAETD